MFKFSSLCLAVLMMMHAPATLAQGAPVDAASRVQLVDAVVRELKAKYVFPTVAKQIEMALREKQQRAHYDRVTDGQALATLLTTELRAISHDLHLAVRYSEKAAPPGRASRPPADDARDRAYAKETNYGLGKVEKLPGNIGYLETFGFGPLGVVNRAFAVAMTTLADSDALIIDMRANGGGSPESVAWLSSYLFDQRTHLNDLYWRADKRTEQFWTINDVPGKKYGQQKPVYVLTGKKTFSGGEEFAYNLQQLKRATLVGETTGGGANPGGWVRLNRHFSMFVPRGRAINPISKTNWEGTGVTPDVKVAAADALVVARKMALEKLAAGERGPQKRLLLRARLADLGK